MALFAYMQKNHFWSFCVVSNLGFEVETACHIQALYAYIKIIIANVQEIIN